MRCDKYVKEGLIFINGRRTKATLLLLICVILLYLNEYLGTREVIVAEL